MKSERANVTPVPQDTQVAVREALSETAQQLRTLPTLTRADLATGRGLTYEWEFFVDQLMRQIAAGGGGGGTGVQTFEFAQNSAASVWTVTHNFGGYPTVLILDQNGQELCAELHYPDEDKVVIVHGQPYTGTAYLRY